MSVVQVELPDELQALVDLQIAEGRVRDAQSFLTEAAQRFVEELAWEGELVEVAKNGIADIEAGRFITITNASDAEAWHQEIMARVRDSLADDQE